MINSLYLILENCTRKHFRVGRHSTGVSSGQLAVGCSLPCFPLDGGQNNNIAARPHDDGPRPRNNDLGRSFSHPPGGWATLTPTLFFFSYRKFTPAHRWALFFFFLVPRDEHLSNHLIVDQKTKQRKIRIFASSLVKSDTS